MEIDEEKMILSSLAHRMSKADKKNFEKFINGNKKKNKKVDHKKNMQNSQKK